MEEQQRHFSGLTYQALDEKGRIVMPPTMRYDLGRTYIITHGLGGCLWAFHQDDWREFAKALAGLPKLNRNAAALRRFFLGSAMEASQDNQNRSLVPLALRQDAKMSDEREVAIIGQGDYIEIWSRRVWESHRETLTDDYIVECAEKLGLAMPGDAAALTSLTG